MDGQFSPKKYLLPLVLFALLLPQTLFAQAMGKAALDAPAAPLAQLTAPATVVQTTESKTIAPLPTTQPESDISHSSEIGNNRTPSPLPATPITTAPTPATTAAAQTDSLPAASLRPIEHQEIKPQTTTKTVDAIAPTPAKSSPTSALTSVFQVLAALAVCIGLALLGKALAKKYLPAAKIAGGKGVIEVLARYPLTKNQSLILVRIGSQIVTLNQGKDQSHSVLVINDPNEVAKILGQIEGKSPTSIQSGFNKLLANARLDLEESPSDNDPNDFESRSMQPENLDSQLEEMAAAKRQLMELRQQVRSVRDSIPR